MRVTTGRSTLFGQKRTASRAAALLVTAGCVVVAAFSGGADALASPALAALPASSWSAYLNGPLHNSYSPSQTAITPANANTLVQEWSQTAASKRFLASPTVFNGSVYIGGGNGYFYRLSERTGQVLAKKYIGFQPQTTCPYGGLGVTSTATVARDPRTQVPTIYVAGGDGYLYALGQYALATKWRSVIAIPSTKINDYYDWSSPTVANGKVYVGVASSCDRPLVRGAVLAYRQATGARFAQFYTVPAGANNAGGTVWSSVAVASNGDVFVTTGNGPYGRPRLRYSESILKLSPNTLALLGRFQVPVSDVSRDGDFGASPVLFGGLVGACNKNGYFYALRQSSMTLVWRQRIAHAAGARFGECLGTPVYDGKDLYFGGNGTTINNVAYPGSVQERSPSTGTLIWETPLPGSVFGSPAMDGAGLIAVGTHGPGTRGVYLVHPGTTDAPLQLMPGDTFAQPVFAENRLFIANRTGVYSWGLPAS